MAGDLNYSIKGNRELGSGDEDKLGFREVAERIATSLVDRASKDGGRRGLGFRKVESPILNWR
jgi:hypothetical protein